jgi:hypothetical protein
MDSAVQKINSVGDNLCVQDETHAFPRLTAKLRQISPGSRILVRTIETRAIRRLTAVLRQISPGSRILVRTIETRATSRLCSRNL